MHDDKRPPPTRRLIRSWLFLVLNIRKQARKDDKLEDFESYWLNTSKKKKLWRSLEVDIEALNGKSILDD